MNSQNRVQTYWTKKDALVVLFYNAVMLIPWFVSVVFGKTSRETIEKLAEKGSLLPITFWVFSLFPISVAIWLINNRRLQSGRSVKELLGIPPKEDVLMAVQTGIFCGLILFFLGFILLQFWAPFLSKWGIEAPSQYLVDVLKSGLISNWQILGIGLVVAIFAPISEEIFYRSILYSQIRCNNNKFVSIILVSAFFALIHTSLYALPSIFLVGLGFALVYEMPLYPLNGKQYACCRCGLIGSIMAHFTFNIMNIVFTIL